MGGIALNAVLGWKNRLIASALAGILLTIVGCSSMRPGFVQQGAAPAIEWKKAEPVPAFAPSDTKASATPVPQAAASLDSTPVTFKSVAVPTPAPTSRTNHVVFTGLPEPPRAETFGEIADNLIAALDSEKGPLDPNSVFAEQAPSKLYRGGKSKPAEAAADTAAPQVAAADLPKGEILGPKIEIPNTAPTPSPDSHPVPEPAKIPLTEKDWLQPPDLSPVPDLLAQAPGDGSAPKDPWLLDQQQPSPRVTEFPPDRPWPVDAPVSAPPDPWKGDAPPVETSPSLVDAPPPALLSDEPKGTYLLGPGDTIDITVWDMPELSRALYIRPDGYISFDLISEVKAGGRTPAALKAEIEQRLEEHLVNPQVNVTVTSVGSKSYFVFGSVASPGVYQYFRQTTLLQGMASAGGFQSTFRAGQPVLYGDLSRIQIIRTYDDRREIITKNLSDLTSVEMLKEDIDIAPGDIIYVPQKSQVVFVFGEVLAPGVVPLVTETRLLEVLLNTGGVRPTARKDQILVIRQAPGGGPVSYLCANLKELERGNLAANIRLQDGDIIYVPQKFIAKVAEFVTLYTSAIQPALETYLTSWDAWFVHERFSALRRNDFGIDSGLDIASPGPNPDP